MPAAPMRRRRRGQDLGPLHGLPTAHKDLQSTKGIRTTFGSRIYKDFVPDEDSPLVERVAKAGTIKSWQDEHAGVRIANIFNEVFGSHTQSLRLFEDLRRKQRRRQAVSLVYGMLPIADGSDMGGSLRNPASFCNVVGLRPSAGRVPSWPAGRGWFTQAWKGRWLAPSPTWHSFFPRLPVPMRGRRSL